MKSQYKLKQSGLRRLQSLWQSLRVNCKTVAKFMVHPAQSTSQPEIHASRLAYRAKSRLYPYLPVDEEQRDWLEQTYHQS